jgi:hypothetical protein
MGSTESGEFVVWGAEQRLDDYLRGRLTRALAELAGIDPDVILSENVDVVVAVLLEKHMPTEIRIDWDGATRTPVKEVTTQVRDQFDRDEIYTVPASKVVVSIPISGTTEMLDYQASTFSLSGKDGKISGGSVIVEVIERTLNAETIRGQVDRVKQDIVKRVAWANGDLAKFRMTAEQAIRSDFVGARTASSTTARSRHPSASPFARQQRRGLQCRHDGGKSLSRPVEHSQASCQSRSWTRPSIRKIGRGCAHGRRPSSGHQEPRRSSTRSEERRVGKECRSRWSPYH